MTFSHLCQRVWQRGSPKSNVAKPGKQILKLESLVETGTEFSQIEEKVLLPNSMVGSVDRILDVAQQGVDP